MGRPRSFDEERILDSAASTFTDGGYAGTSIDDLVRALDLHRGSLYQAFGSKRGLFLAVLRHEVDGRLTQLAAEPSDRTENRGARHIDLLLVAAQERGHRDPEVAALVRQGLALLERAEPPAPAERPRPTRALDLLASRLYDRLLHDRSTDMTDPTDMTETPDMTKEI